MKNLLTSFNKRHKLFTIKVKIFKETYKDDYHEGQGEHVSSHYIDTKVFFAQSITAPLDNIVKRVLNDLNTLLGYDTTDYCSVVDDHLCVCVLEDEEGYQIEGSKEDYEQEDIYLCDYMIYLWINNIPFSEKFLSRKFLELRKDVECA